MRYCLLGMVVLLGGCDGCGGDGIVELSLVDASFDIRDGGLDGLGDRPGPAGAGGAPRPGSGGATGGVGVAPGAPGGAGTGVAGTGSGVAGAAGARAGSGAVPGGSGGTRAGSGGVTGSGGTAGSSGRGGTGGSGGTGSGIRCDIYYTCWYPDGRICDTSGFCCTVNANGRCCNGNRCKPAPVWNAPPVPPTVDEPWTPPMAPELVGAPGWRQSDEIFCTNRAGNTYAHSVWSDSRGVFVAAIGDGQYGGDADCPWCVTETIRFNDGTGWTDVPRATDGSGPPVMSGQLGMTGFDNGPLVLYGYGAYDSENDQPCGLSLLDAGQRSCEPVDGISDVHVVDASLAYAVLNGSLIRYDGERWGPVPAVAPSQSALFTLWADDTVVMATSQMPGTIYTLREGTWTIEDTRTLEYFSALWGFAPDDVWAGTYQGGLYHYDGTAWSEVSWPGSDCSGEASVIISMWGADGVLYFVTPSAVGRWNGTQAETIAKWGCEPYGNSAGITSVWGNSPTEVFFSIADSRQPFNACGSTFVMYYDGQLFHTM